MSAIILEPFKADQDSIIKCITWLNDPEVVKFSEQRHRKHTQSTQTDYINGNPLYYYGIYIPHLIGTLSAEIDYNNRVANVGIMIGDKSMWRKGYGFSAWESYCNMLLSGHIRKIEAGCMAHNYGMISIFLKYGMSFEAYIPGHFLVDGEEVAEVRYGKFNESSSNI